MNALVKVLPAAASALFPFGFEGGIWDLIILVPDHCISFYFVIAANSVKVVQTF